MILDLSAETSYSQAMYFAEEAAQFCELLTASYSYLSVGSDAFRLNNIFQQVWQNVFKKTRQRRYHALHGDFVALPGVKVLWLEEYFIKNGLGP